MWWCQVDFNITVGVTSATLVVRVIQASWIIRVRIPGYVPIKPIGFKPNCIILFNNMFHYLQVLKPTSRTLLNIFRYSKVLVSVLKPKTQKGLAAYSREQLANRFLLDIFVSHI